MGGGGSQNLSRICFQMAPSLSYGQQEGFDLGTDPLGATGCFAIGGVRLGGGTGAVRACQCGARNGSGQWARTASNTSFPPHAGPNWAAPRTDRCPDGPMRGAAGGPPFSSLRRFQTETLPACLGIGHPSPVVLSSPPHDDPPGGCCVPPGGHTRPRRHPMTRLTRTPPPP